MLSVFGFTIGGVKMWMAKSLSVKNWVFIRILKTSQTNHVQNGRNTSRNNQPKQIKHHNKEEKIDVFEIPKAARQIFYPANFKIEKWWSLFGTRLVIIEEQLGSRQFIRLLYV